MSDVYFTLHGHHTGQRWLVNMFDCGAVLIEPTFWSLSEYTGISYAGAAGKYYHSKWPAYLMLRIKLRMWRIEHRWKRRDRRHARIEALAQQHGGKPTVESEA